jgi:hypothetical protein
LQSGPDLEWARGSKHAEQNSIGQNEQRGRKKRRIGVFDSEFDGSKFIFVMDTLSDYVLID